VSNNITTVRQHLLDTLADLRNRETPMDIDRARAVADVARVLVDSAKVEVDFIKASGADGSGFLESGESVDQLPSGITGIRRHMIK
jgi:methionine synthase I (cobalamin-dependent)